MKILLIGGTGVMGMYLVEELIRLGYIVYITTRKEKNNQEKIKYITCNAKNIFTLKEILNDNYDVVVDFMNYNTEEFKERFPLLLNATSQYFYLSSCRIYAESDTPVLEDSPKLLDVSNDDEYLKTDEYGLAKARQERILTDSSFKNWTIVRPYITFGINRFQLEGMEKEEWLYRALQNHTLLVSKPIEEKTTTLTFGKDVAQCIAGLIGRTDALFNDFNLTSSDHCSWRELREIYTNALTKKLQIPIKVREVSNPMEIHYPWAKYQVRYDRCFNRSFSNQKITTLLGGFTFQNVERSLNESINQFLDNPIFKRIDWILEARKDKISKEWASWSEFPDFMTAGRYFKHRLF